MANMDRLSICSFCLSYRSGDVTLHKSDPGYKNQFLLDLDKAEVTISSQKGERVKLSFVTTDKSEISFHMIASFCVVSVPAYTTIT